MKPLRFDILLILLPQEALCFQRASARLARVALDEHAGDVVAAALQALPPLKRRARILVAAADFFTQRLTLPAAQTAGLGSADLRRALIFEVEPFSHLGVANSELAYRAGERAASAAQTWQVLQLSHEEIASIGAAVQERGLRLAGFAPADEELQGIADQPEALAAWCEACSGRLPPAPLLPAALKRRRGVALEGIAVAAILLVLLGVLMHYSHSDRDLRGLRHEVDQRARLDAEIKRTAAANSALQGQLQEQRQLRQRQQEMHLSLLHYRRAWPALLRALLTASDQSLVIREIQGGDYFMAEISGLSSSERSPGSYVARLAETLNDSGWELDEVYQHSTLKDAGGAGVIFGLRATLALPEGARSRPQPLEEEIW